MKKIINDVMLGFGLAIGVVSLKAQIPVDYKGEPYHDEMYTGNKLNPFGAQNLPGRVELAFYDLGDEGVCYHDNTTKNQGTHLYNQTQENQQGISDFLLFFRENEGVDITYIKHDLDFSASNKVDPKANQLYLSNPDEGEWTNYTIYVHQKGNYIIYTTYSSIDNRPAELWVNNQFASKLAFPEKTGNTHSWTQAEVGQISFPTKGVYLLTIKYGGGVSFGYLDFLYNDNRQNRNILNKQIEY